MQIGAYSRIVCEKCEASFHAEDELFIAAFRFLNQAPVFDEGVATILDGFDGSQLKRAVLSILFRANLSDHELFRDVNLGPYEDELRRYLVERSGDVSSVFSVALRHVTGKDGRIVLNCMRAMLGGAHTYRIYMPHLTALVKVDKRPWEKSIAYASLGSTNPPVALRVDSLAPSERRAISLAVEPHVSRIEKAFRRFR